MSDGISGSPPLSNMTQGSGARQLSDILIELAGDETRVRISIGDLVGVFGNRAFGTLMFLFAVPNVVPSPVLGISAILGAPLVFLTWQLMVGQGRPWLPSVILNRSFDRRDFSRVVSRTGPWLRRIERTIRPRLLFMTQPVGRRLVGMVGFVLAVILALPIPLGNMLPALAICLLALGILERDGISILLGAVAGVISLALVSGVIYGLAVVAIFIIRNAVGA